MYILIFIATVHGYPLSTIQSFPTLTDCYKVKNKIEKESKDKPRVTIKQLQCKAKNSLN